MNSLLENHKSCIISGKMRTKLNGICTLNICVCLYTTKVGITFNNPPVMIVIRRERVRLVVIYTYVHLYKGRCAFVVSQIHRSIHEFTSITEIRNNFSFVGKLPSLKRKLWGSTKIYRVFCAV